MSAGARAYAPARHDPQGIPADPARSVQHRHRLRAAGGAAVPVRLRRLAGCPRHPAWPSWWSSRTPRHQRAWSASFERSEFFAPVRYRDIRAGRAGPGRADRATRSSGCATISRRRLLVDGETAPIGGADQRRGRQPGAHHRRLYPGGLVQPGWRNTPATHGLELLPPAVLEQRVWFNAALRQPLFLVPGLIAIDHDPDRRRCSPPWWWRGSGSAAPWRR